MLYKLKNFMWLVRFFWRLRKIIPWDCQSIYYLVYCYLDEFQLYCKKSSHLEWNKNEDTQGMRKVRECKVLAKRLMDDNYIHNSLKSFKVDLLCFPIRVSDEKDFRRAADLSSRQRKSENEKFFKLLKRLEEWWD